VVDLHAGHRGRHGQLRLRGALCEALDTLKSCRPPAGRAPAHEKAYPGILSLYFFIGITYLSVLPFSELSKKVQENTKKLPSTPFQAGKRAYL
jgi:hypothetical protein